MITQKCALCGRNNFSVLYPENFDLKAINEKTFSARRLPDRAHYRMVRCKTCGLVYSNPILPFKKIEQLYKESEYTYGTYEQELTETYARYVDQYIAALPELETFLEIGCGNGFFLLWAKQCGFKKVFGVEPGQPTIDQADPKIRKNIIVDIFRKGQFKKNSIDLICLFQILDHIPDPNAFLGECLRIVKPGGGVLCINHDVQSYSAKLLGEKSPIIDIEHTYLYDKKTLPQIFTRNGFLSSHAFDVSNVYPLEYWLRMFPLPGSIKSPLGAFFSLIGIDKLRIRIPAGNIGVFARKPNQ